MTGSQFRNEFTVGNFFLLRIRGVISRGKPNDSQEHRITNKMDPWAIRLLSHEASRPLSKSRTGNANFTGEQPLAKGNLDESRESLDGSADSVFS
jgi:hypothetical protein